MLRSSVKGSTCIPLLQPLGKGKLLEELFHAFAKQSSFWVVLMLTLPLCCLNHNLGLICSSLPDG